MFEKVCVYAPRVKSTNSFHKSISDRTNQNGVVEKQFNLLRILNYHGRVEESDRKAWSRKRKGYVCFSGRHLAPAINGESIARAADVGVQKNLTSDTLFLIQAPPSFVVLIWSALLVAQQDVMALGKGSINI
jgi:hypothetical protein